MNDAFRALCAELGYSPDRVLSVRVNAGQVVVVAWNDSGELQVTTYAQDPDGLRLVSQGTPIDVRRSRRAPEGYRNPGISCSSPAVDTAGGQGRDLTADLVGEGGGHRHPRRRPRL